MLIGVMGKMGSGKTLSMSALGEFLHYKTKAPLYANYSLLNATRVQSLGDIWKMENGIFCFDEMWLTMDARMWKDNVKLSRWVNQTRKKKLIVIYTTQHIRQMELRVREATDLLIYTTKVKDGIGLQFIDYQYQELKRKYYLPNKRKFYFLYNTFETLQPIAI